MLYGREELLEISPTDLFTQFDEFRVIFGDKIVVGWLFCESYNGIVRVEGSLSFTTH